MQVYCKEKELSPKEKALKRAKESAKTVADELLYTTNFPCVHEMIDRCATKTQVENLLATYRRKM